MRLQRKGSHSSRSGLESTAVRRQFAPDVGLHLACHELRPAVGQRLPQLPIDVVLGDHHLGDLVLPGELRKLDRLSNQVLPWTNGWLTGGGVCPHAAETSVRATTTHPVVSAARNRPKAAHRGLSQVEGSGMAAHIAGISVGRYRCGKARRV